MSKGKSMTTARKRRITLQNLIADGDEIWVINRSGEKTGKEAGNIVLETRSGNMVDVVVIPPGEDPICLTDQVTPKLLADCMDLFKHVRSEMLELLDPKDADTYYAQNQERKVIVEEKINKFISREKEGNPKTPQEAKSANVQIHPKVGDICLKAKHAAVSEREALEKLMEQTSVLTVDDYNYIVSNGVFDGLKNWAKERLEQAQ